MKINIFIFINILILFSSCSGQNNKEAIAPKDYDRINKPDKVRSLSNNIMIVHQDKKNNYWFGSWQDGLYKYDGKNISHYTTLDGLPHNRIEEIKEDNSGNIYINTSKGICRFDGLRFTILKEIIIDENSWKLSVNDIWFKSNDQTGHVFRYDGKVLYKMKLPKCKISEDHISAHPDYPDPYNVYCVYKDSQGNVWFGTAVLGALRYNGHSFEWISETDVTEFHNGPSNGVRSIIEDKDGYFWFNTAYKYKIYPKKSREKEYSENQLFYRRIKNIGTLGSSKTSQFTEYLSIRRDEQDHLWIVTYDDGVWKYDGVETTHIPVRVNSVNIHLFAIYKDNHGIMWLGTQENGVFKSNGKTFEKFNLN